MINRIKGFYSNGGEPPRGNGPNPSPQGPQSPSPAPLPAKGSTRRAVIKYTAVTAGSLVAGVSGTLIGVATYNDSTRRSQWLDNMRISELERRINSLVRENKEYESRWDTYVDQTIDLLANLSRSSIGLSDKEKTDASRLAERIRLSPRSWKSVEFTRRTEARIGTSFITRILKKDDLDFERLLPENEHLVRDFINYHNVLHRLARGYHALEESFKERSADIKEAQRLRLEWWGRKEYFFPTFENTRDLAPSCSGPDYALLRNGLSHDYNELLPRISQAQNFLKERERALKAESTKTGK